MPTLLGALWNPSEAHSAQRDLFLEIGGKLFPGVAPIQGAGFAFFVNGIVPASDGQHLVMLIGELFNREELRKGTKLPPDATDSEVLLATRSACGDLLNAAREWNGPFTAVSLNLATGRCKLLREAMGEKDLFHTEKAANGLLYFSDDLETLSTLPGVSHDVDVAAFADYMALGYVPAPKTIYAGIRKLPIGSCATFFGGKQTELTPFWQPKYEIDSKRTWQETVEIARERLVAAIGRRLERHPEFTYMLSGGIDSGTLLGLTQKYFPASGRRAVTVSFQEKDYDELSLTRAAATRNGVELDVVHATSDDMRILPELMQIAGEPFADSSVLASTLGMRGAHDECLMTGDGGDELFGGYRRYQAMALRHRVPAFLDAPARGLAACLRALLPTPKENRTRLATLTRGLDVFARKPLEAYSTFQKVAGKELCDQLIRTIPERTFLDVWKEDLERLQIATPVLRYNALDILHYSTDDGCRKQTIAEAASGKAVISPLLDMELLAFTTTMTADFRQNAHETKRVLRAIGAEFLPVETLKQTKRGFGVPISEWFRNALAKDAREMARSVHEWDTHQLLNENAVQQVVEAHALGKENYGALLWALTCLRCWELRHPA